MAYIVAGLIIRGIAKLAAHLVIHHEQSASLTEQKSLSDLQGK